jgi:hypothetical protein
VPLELYLATLSNRFTMTAPGRPGLPRRTAVPGSGRFGRSGDQCCSPRSTMPAPAAANRVMASGSLAWRPCRAPPPCVRREIETARCLQGAAPPLANASPCPAAWVELRWGPACSGGTTMTAAAGNALLKPVAPRARTIRVRRGELRSLYPVWRQSGQIARYSRCPPPRLGPRDTRRQSRNRR